MATKKPEPTPVEGDEKAGGGKKKLLLVAGPLVIALVAGWFFLLGPGGGSGGPEKPEKVKPGEVVALDPITMNLADGRLLKVGLALQVVEKPSSKHEISGSIALDQAISFLGKHTYEQLAAPAGREKAKKELSHLVGERYHHDVMEVYFTEFVMQ